MAINTFEIDYKDAKESIEYTDELTFGELEAVLNNSCDLTDLNKPKINIPQYRMDILCKVITKAPFEIGSAVAIRNLPANTVGQIISGVMKDYPLGKFLTEWMKTFSGDQNETNI